MCEFKKFLIILHDFIYTEDKGLVINGVFGDYSVILWLQLSEANVLLTSPCYTLQY